MNQLFAVGEVVILQSIDEPAYWNNEATITSVEWYDSPVDIYGNEQPSQYAYRIDICNGRFAQNALKKRQDPAPDSFDMIMESLTDAVLV